jgi:hypothetical protein
LPGGAKYGDLTGLLSLAAPTKLLLAGETNESATLVAKTYAASGTAGGLQVDSSTPDEARTAAVAWMIKAE